MYTLKAKVNFYDKEHPGVLLHPGELLSTKSEERAKNLVERGFAEIVSVPEAPAEKAEAPVVNEAPAVEQAAEAEKEPEAENSPEAPAEKVVSVDGSDYDLTDVKQALNAIGVKTAANAGIAKVSEKISELSEAQIAELKNQLSK